MYICIGLPLLNGSVITALHPIEISQRAIRLNHPDVNFHIIGELFTHVPIVHSQNIYITRLVQYSCLNSIGFIIIRFLSDEIIDQPTRIFVPIQLEKGIYFHFKPVYVCRIHLQINIKLLQRFFIPLQIEESSALTIISKFLFPYLQGLIIALQRRFILV
ncbi:hypothetical protein D3C77_398540 [compost metagenome]